MVRHAGAGGHAHSRGSSSATAHFFDGGNRGDFANEKGSIKKAVFLLQQGCGHRPQTPVFEDAHESQSIAAFRFYHSPWFDLFGTAILLIQLTLCFVEPISLLLPPTSETAYLSLNTSMMVEGYCVVIHLLSLYVTHIGEGSIRTGMLSCCVLSLISLLCTAMLPPRMLIRGLFRIYRLLRPFYSFIYYENARRWFHVIGHSFARVWHIVLFGTFAIVGVFSIFVWALYNQVFGISIQF